MKQRWNNFWSSIAGVFEVLWLMVTYQPCDAVGVLGNYSDSADVKCGDWYAAGHPPDDGKHLWLKTDKGTFEGWYDTNLKKFYLRGIGNPNAKVLSWQPHKWGDD